MLRDLCVLRLWRPGALAELGGGASSQWKVVRSRGAVELSGALLTHYSGGFKNPKPLDASQQRTRGT